MCLKNPNKVDKNKTKIIVENVLKEYARIVTTFTSGNSTLNLNEDIKITYFEFTIAEFINRMELIFNALSSSQKHIIIERYVRNNGNSLDCDVLDSTYLSERTYYREKLSALLFISELLDITKYIE